MIIQCSIVATCSSGLVMQARYLASGNTLPVKKIKVCYDANLSLKDNALKSLFCFFGWAMLLACFYSFIV